MYNVRKGNRILEFLYLEIMKHILEYPISKIRYGCFGHKGVKAPVNVSSSRTKQLGYKLLLNAYMQWNNLKVQLQCN